jgi:hypothetical protein
MQRNKNLPLLCGVIDSAIILMVFLIFATIEGKPPKILFQQNPGIVFGFLLPLCVVTAWRGAALTKKLIIGQCGWLRPATEGFLMGFLPVPFMLTIGMLIEALAAGPPWPSLGHAIEGEWSSYFLWVVQISLLTGIVGAVYGLAISYVNRVLIRRWSANLRSDHDRA